MQATSLKTLVLVSFQILSSNLAKNQIIYLSRNWWFRL